MGTTSPRLGRRNLPLSTRIQDNLFIATIRAHADLLLRFPNANTPRLPLFDPNTPLDSTIVNRVLRDPASIFRCQICHDSFSYPTIIEHLAEPKVSRSSEAGANFTVYATPRSVGRLDKMRWASPAQDIRISAASLAAHFELYDQLEEAAEEVYRRSLQVCVEYRCECGWASESVFGASSVVRRFFLLLRFAP